MLLGVTAAFVVGYFWMLPDDFENLAESVVATSYFGNNVLAAITVKNYWNIQNLYRPLMHTWYVGVLMQIYVFMGIIFTLINHFCTMERKRLYNFVLFGLTIISFVAYLVCHNAGIVFYMPWFRLWEFTAGCLVCHHANENEDECDNNWCTYLLTFVVFVLLFCPYDIVGAKARLIITVVATSSVLTKIYNCEIQSRCLNLVALTGKASLSLYVWHQIIIAYWFYHFSDTFTFKDIVGLLLAIAVVTYLSYRFVELPLYELLKGNMNFIKQGLIAGLFATGLLICGLLVYLRAGVVRDVPELDIYVENVHRGMHAEYVDKGYKFDRDFVDVEKVKVLVLGNSFGRDWINVLLESKYANEVVISYISNYDEQGVKKRENRFEKADVIFCAMGPELGDLPDSWKKRIGMKNYYVVGNKKFGLNNGLIYRYHKGKDYFESKANISNELVISNCKYRQQYGNRYIDMLKPVLCEENRVRVFSFDNRYISQDCSHLTRAGAQYYSQVLDIEKILEL